MNENFEYLLNTGSQSVLENRETLESKNRVSTIFNNYIDISKSILTGHFSIRVSVNGETLFEEYPDLQIINQVEYFSIESGDYFVTTDFNDNGRVYFNGEYPNGTEVVYEAKDVDSGSLSFQSSTGLGVVQSSTIPEITGKLITNPPSDLNDFFDRWDFFFDGVKTYEYEYQNLDDKTGIAFAYEKNQDLFQVTGYNSDVYGLSFLPKQRDLYVDGLEKPPTSTLELYNGVNTIETGVYSSINIETNKTNNFYL